MDDQRNVELPSIVVPRLFLFIAQNERDLRGDGIRKALRFYDFLTNQNPDGFQPSLLNGAFQLGSARMAWELYDYVFNTARAPQWFAEMIKDLPVQPEV